MKEAIGQILPIGIVVSISPVPIIAVVLMLATPRARVNGPAFVLGWIVGLGALGTLILLTSSGLDASEGGEPATWVSWLKLVLGALLVLVALRQWRGRNAADRQEPKWMQSVDHVFVVIGTLGPGIPVALYFILGERSKTMLDDLNSWMAANNAVIMAVLLLVIGAKLFGDGLAGL